MLRRRTIDHETMAGEPSRVGEQQREALHPPVDGDVIDPDSSLGEQFFNVVVGRP
jgi:hypothetical protein